MNPNEFLSNTDWHDAKINWFDADWSVRRYSRLTRSDGQQAILLDSPPDHAPETMIGHQIGPWVTMDRHYRKLGLNTPEIYAEDLNHGFVLMEDFGNTTIEGKGAEAYHNAIDVLTIMRDHRHALDIDLVDYKDTHVYKALRFYPEYILKNPDATQGWFDAWDHVERSLPPCPQSLTHIDFAPMNLMWLPERHGTNSIGILDFQASCRGPLVYDLVNLIDHARFEIADDLKQSCLDRYYATLSPDRAEIVDAWYPVMAAQFHARVLGQIIKLNEVNGRDDLMVYYDQLRMRFEKELQNPALAPILQFIQRETK